MARTSYIPEKEKPEPRYGKGDADFRTAGKDVVPPNDAEGWEFQSIANFLEFMTEECLDTFSTADLVALAANTGIYNRTLRFMLEESGLKLKGVEPEKQFRTFGSNPHDRWSNPEARRMNGGGGGDSIMGFAGRAG